MTAFVGKSQMKEVPFVLYAHCETFGPEVGLRIRYWIVSNNKA